MTTIPSARRQAQLQEKGQPVPLMNLLVVVTLAVMATVPAAACGTEPTPHVTSTPTTASSAAPLQPAPSEQPAPSSASAPINQLVQLTYGDGQVTGVAGRVTVALGSTVTLQVTSDAAEEVHLHGYNLSTPVAAGSPAVPTFTADIPGVFEVELRSPV